MAPRRSEVDGVPVLLAPSAGPMRAGLTFRVGRADETLATSGITHLLEHLALFGHGLADYHYNGATGVIVTHFVMEGEPEKVVEFLNGVCAALTDLPLHRVEIEKKILETEAAGRRPAVSEPLWLWRHGAADFGLVSYPEWGLRRIDADAVAQWSRSWFTRDNAVLWIAGDGVPAGLKLTLPEGERRPLPAESSALPVTPAYFNGDGANAIMDCVVPRGSAAMVFTKALERALYRRLRQEDGLSYTAATSYDVHTTETAKVLAIADALPDRRTEMVSGFVGVLRDMATTEISSDELTAAKSLLMEPLRHADADAKRLPGLAAGLLLGREPVPASAVVQDVAQVTAAQVREIASAGYASTLLMVPNGQVLERLGFEEAPVRSRFAVTGTRYRARNHHEVSMVVGADGISYDTPRGPLTVLFDRCAAMLAWPDGARQLIGLDGVAVRAEPSLYRGGASITAALDQRVPASLVVPMPERTAQAIPAAQRFSTLRSRWRAFALRADARRGRLRFLRLRFGRRAVTWGLVATMLGLCGVGLADPATIYPIPLSIVVGVLVLARVRR